MPPSMGRVATDPMAPGSDPQLRRARIATLAALGTALLTSLVMPGIGLLFEPSVWWIVLGMLPSWPPRQARCTGWSHRG